MRLIVSPFEKLFSNDKQNILLGHWCLNTKIDKKKQELISSYHWQNRDKFIQDFIYLNKLVEKTNHILANELNRLHKTNYSHRFWYLLLNPWVSMFVSAIFDRWSSVEKAFHSFDISEVSFLNLKKNLPPKTFNDYLGLYNDHYWNHNIFKNIIIFLKIKNLKISNIESDYKSIGIKDFEIKKNFFKIYIDKFLSIFDKSNKVVLIDNYFHPNDLVRLSLNLGQIPRVYNEFYKKIDLPLMDKTYREKLNFYNSSNKFEEFLFNYLSMNLPISFLEGFEKIIKEANKIKIKTNLVITGNANFPTELCKFWCALQSEKKINIILNEHGGSIPTKYRYYDIHDKIFTNQISWSREKSKNEKRLSPSKLLRFQNLKSSKKNLSIVTLETSQYAYYCQNLQSSIILDDFNQKLNYLKILRIKNIKFKIKTYRNMGWNLKEKYKNLFGEKYLTNKNVKSVIKNSKLIVCTYPETTFLESMCSGVPTILLYLHDIWKFDDRFKSTVDNLYKNKIIFYSPEDAADHTEKIINNPYIWWNNKNTLIARNQFFEDCGRISPDWLDEWKKYILEKNDKT